MSDIRFPCPADVVRVVSIPFLQCLKHLRELVAVMAAPPAIALSDDDPDPIEAAIGLLRKQGFDDEEIIERLQDAAEALREGLI
jgi:hypothetical protein